MFRPCIDLHEGRVKQIVGGSLSDEPAQFRTNFVSYRPARWFAELYKRDGLTGGHVILHAGGANSLADLEAVSRLGQGRVHLTIGSALDIFGGTGVRYADVVEFNKKLNHG